MALYAHARIEAPDGSKVWDRGDEITEAEVEDLGLDPQYGAVSDQPYDPEADKSPAPEIVEIDGVRYVKESVDA